MTPAASLTPSARARLQALAHDIGQVESLVRERGYGTEADKPAMLARLTAWRETAFGLTECAPAEKRETPSDGAIDDIAEAIAWRFRPDTGEFEGGRQLLRDEFRKRLCADELEAALLAEAERPACPDDREVRLRRAVKWVHENPMLANEFGLATAVNIAWVATFPPETKE